MEEHTLQGQCQNGFLGETTGKIGNTTEKDIIDTEGGGTLGEGKEIFDCAPDI